MDPARFGSGSCMEIFEAIEKYSYQLGGKSLNFKKCTSFCNFLESLINRYSIKDPEPDPQFRISDPDPGAQLITDPLDPNPQHCYLLYICMKTSTNQNWQTLPVEENEQKMAAYLIMVLMSISE
jgi:hypothetical protein